MDKKFLYLAKLGIIESNDESGKYDIQRIDDVETFRVEHELNFTPPQLESDDEAKAIFNTITIETLESLDDNTQMKDDIEDILFKMWGSIGMDIPDNYEDIVQDCFEDVLETADPINWSNGDVAIAFRRWIEKQNNSK